MNVVQKIIAATLALIVTLAGTALVFAPVALAHSAPAVSRAQSLSSSRPALVATAPVGLKSHTRNSQITTRRG